MFTISIACLLSVGAPPPPDDDVAPLLWRDEKYEADELPPGLMEGALHAYTGWAGWAAKYDYRLALSDDQRILLVHHARRIPRSDLELVAATQAMFDDFLPLPDRTDEASAEEAEPQDYVPGDDWTWEWEDDGGPLETSTGVVLELRNEADQRAVISKLQNDFPYLEGWAQTAINQVGFSLERPLCAAWLEEAAGQEEWDPEHELINRTTQILTLRRFGQVPFWLLQGIGWAVEWEMRGSLYCFPYRSEFIFEVEHDAWLDLLSDDFEDRKQEPLEITEVSSWRRGKFNASPGRKAFGLVRFLQKYRSDALPAFVERLRLHRDEHDRIDLGDGNWKRIPGYEVPAEDQQQALLEVAGEDVLIEATEYFRKLSRYRPPKR